MTTTHLMSDEQSPRPIFAEPAEALITGEASQVLLRRSIGFKDLSDVDVDEQALDRLRRIYEAYKSRCVGVQNAPRYLPFYMAIQERYPHLDIKWETRPQPRPTNPRHRQVDLTLPRLSGRIPSIASLLLQDLPEQSLQAFRRPGAELPKYLRDDLADLLRSTHAVLRQGETLRDMTPLMLKGIGGDRLTVVCPVCPDYEHEATGDPDQPYRYTFEGLGDGIGLVAARLLQDLPRYHRFFQRNNIDVQFVIAHGDFEALSDETLRQVGVSKEEFRQRLEGSARAIESAAAGLPVVSAFFMDLCGGESGWVARHERARGALEATLVDRVAASIGIDWRDILEARRPLYERWVGPRACAGEYLPFLLNQGAEYSVMGELARELYPNSLLLCCDHHAMAPFFRMSGRLPVIYLKRSYA